MELTALSAHTGTIGPMNAPNTTTQDQRNALADDLNDLVRQLRQTPVTATTLTGPGASAFTAGIVYVIDVLRRHETVRSSGPCAQRSTHPPHLELHGDHLNACHGQRATCANCDDLHCMGCVMREVHDTCEHDCPDCGPGQAGPNPDLWTQFTHTLTDTAPGPITPKQVKVCRDTAEIAQENYQTGGWDFTTALGFLHANLTPYVGTSMATSLTAWILHQPLTPTEK